MQLNELMEIADNVYPDGLISEYWSREKQCPIYNPKGGDTLAYFIVFELFETFDSNANYIDQLEEAERVMDRAAQQLEDLSSEFHDKAMIHRRTALK